MTRGNGRIRPADDLLLPAVHETIAKLTLTPEDTAAATLAEHYARTIDAAGGELLEAEVLKELGPKLLACLEALGATPRARALLRKGVPGNGGKSALQEIRNARA